MQVTGLMVCFTGPAIDKAGDPILREVLTKAAVKAGMIVQGSFTTGTQLLVASRADTTKAVKAALRGIPVLTYPSFLERFHLTPGLGHKGFRNPRVDTHHIHTPKSVDPNTWVDIL